VLALPGGGKGEEGGGEEGREGGRKGKEGGDELASYAALVKEMGY